MDKKDLLLCRLVFGASCLYDGILGLAFLLAAPRLFEYFEVTPPNHYGYVQFPALILLIFAWLFFSVARKPQTNRNLILYGIMLKLAYAGTVLYYWTTSELPNLWKPFAVIDLMFAVLFVWNLTRIPRR